MLISRLANEWVLAPGMRAGMYMRFPSAALMAATTGTVGRVVVLVEGETETEGDVMVGVESVEAKTGTIEEARVDVVGELSVARDCTAVSGATEALTVAKIVEVRATVEDEANDKVDTMLEEVVATVVVESSDSFWEFWG